MKIVTSLSFQGQCREAFEFYARVLGGKVTAAIPFGEGPADMPVDPRYKDWLMHCWLEVGDQALMGADMPPEFAPNIGKPKNGFDVTFHSEDAAEARRVFDALSEGGNSERTSEISYEYFVTAVQSLRPNSERRPLFTSPASFAWIAARPFGVSTAGASIGFSS